MKYLIALLLCLSLCGCGKSVTDTLWNMDIGECGIYELKSNSILLREPKQYYIIYRLTEEEYVYAKNNKKFDIAVRENND